MRRDAESPTAEAERTIATGRAPERATDVNFKNEGDYKRWLAYGHMHGKFHGQEHVSIGGNSHHVKHDCRPVSGMDAILGIK